MGIDNQETKLPTYWNTKLLQDLSRYEDWQSIRQVLGHHQEWHFTVLSNR